MSQFRVSINSDSEVILTVVVMKQPKLLDIIESKDQIVSECQDTSDDFLQKLLDIMCKNENWNGAIYIKSRVSLIRAWYVKSDVDCDITFNNELAMANTKLIKYFYRIQPECK